MANYVSAPIEYSFKNPNSINLKNLDVNFDMSSKTLINRGLNILVEISTASSSIDIKSPIPQPLNKIQVYAQFDTGANRTSIDIKLATYLNLVSLGTSELITAGGKYNFPNFIVDFQLIETELNPFIDLDVNSCDLSFNLAKNLKRPSIDNFGVLIGRDIMSKWHITWNGPTSTVIISD